MNRTILVVDDDAEVRLLLSMLLQLNGWQVREARDGLDALEILSGEYRPDAIVLDMMMPNLDGMGVCRALRRKPETAKIPIIMLSGRPTTTSINEGMQAGADIYLTKPPDMEEFIAHLHQLTETGKTAITNLQLTT